MARRKRQLLEDDSDSSSVSDADDFNETTFDDSNPDAREERELFENPYKRQRKAYSRAPCSYLNAPMA